MKYQMYYTILTILAVVTGGLSVFYNLSLREQFAVVVQYSLPAPGNAQAAEVEYAQPDMLYGEDTQSSSPYLYDDYFDEAVGSVVLVTFPLDLNQATLDELMYIPRVGNVTAQRIVQYRDALGGYTDLRQLMEISGIGEKTYETIAPYLYIDGEQLQEESEE